MRRIAVVGCGGSGKSHLARGLAAALGLPVTHLDALYYDAAWRPLPMDDFAAAQRHLVAAPAWVIDGNYATTLPIRLAACDTVVFLDVPTVTALRGVLSRQLRYGGGHHGNGVHNRVSAQVLRYVLTYRRRMRPRVLAAVAEHAPDAVLVRLRGRGHARRWLAGVAAARTVR
jgi:adenylate kinase family enzyme